MLSETVCYFVPCHGGDGPGLHHIHHHDSPLETRHSHHPYRKPQEEPTDIDQHCHYVHHQRFGGVVCQQENVKDDNDSSLMCYHGLLLRPQSSHYRLQC